MVSFLSIMIVALGIWTLFNSVKLRDLERKNKVLENWIRYLRDKTITTPAQTTQVANESQQEPASQIDEPYIAPVDIAIPPPPPPPPVAYTKDRLFHVSAKTRNEQAIPDVAKVKFFTSERLLAAGGGLLVLIGTVFLLLLAFNEGWISPQLRVWSALIGGIGLLVAGFMLGEKRQRLGKGLKLFDPAGILVGTGIGVSLLGILLGVFRYDMFSTAAGFLLTAAFGIIAVLIADRWRAQDIAAFGLLLAFVSPLLNWGNFTIGQLGLIGILLVAAGVINARRNWNWLNYLALLITLPELFVWLVDKPLELNYSRLFVFVGYWVLMFITTIAPRVFNETRRASIYVHLLTLTALMFGTGHVLINHLTTNRPGQALVIHMDEIHAFAIFSLTVAAIYFLIGIGLLFAKTNLRELGVFVISLASFMLLIGTAEAIDKGSILLLALSLEAVLLALTYIHSKSNIILSAIFAHLFAIIIVFFNQDFSQIILDTNLSKSWEPISLVAYPTFALLLLWGVVNYVVKFKNSRINNIVGPMLLVGLIGSLSAVLVQLATTNLDFKLDVGSVDSAAQGLLAFFWAVLAIIIISLDQALSRLSDRPLKAGIAWSLAILASIWGLLLFTPVFTSFYLLAAFCCLVILAVALYRKFSTIDIGLVAYYYREIMLVWILLAAAPFYEGLSIGFDNLLRPLVFYLAWFLIVYPLTTYLIPQSKRYNGMLLSLVFFIATSSIITSIFGDGKTFQEAAQAALTLWWVFLGFVLYLSSWSQSLLTRFGKIITFNTDSIIRKIGLILLAISSAKLVLIDMQALDAVPRVLAFIGSGLVLLLASWLGQRYSERPVEKD